MIGPGSLPRYRPRALLRRSPLAYTRMRKRSRSRANHAARSTQARNTDIVAFDHGPAEFPLATMRPRETRAQITAAIGAIQRWLVDRWRWLRPRSVPCAVAALGMIAVMASADYLAHYKEDCVKQHAAPVHIDLAPR